MKKFILILIVITAQVLIAQKQGNIWYFGIYAGLDFNSGHPVELKDGKLNKGPSSIICDQNGKLLFYTNGSEVWNKQHKIMDNGFQLKGDDSMCSVTIIVRKPGIENIYYIFSKESWASLSTMGFSYSIVNLDSNNGLGKVIDKNIILMGKSTNHLTATLHKNGEDIWIIARNIRDNNYYRFHSFLITENGVNNNPVISDGCFGSGAHNLLQGQMKISPDGKYLLFVGGLGLVGFNVPDEMTPDDCRQELYDFDNETGVISGGTRFGTTNDEPNGVEFSNDSKLFYISYSRKLMGQVKHVNRLEQFQTEKIIQSVDTSIQLYHDTINYVEYGQLQLAPDGKIYLAKSYYTKYLAVINNPNDLGFYCSFVNDGFRMEFGQPNGKLPISLQSYYLVKVDITGNDNYCEGDTIILNPKFSGNFVNPFYDWIGPNNFHSTNEICIVPDVDINNSGTYTLKVVDTATGFTAESYKYILVNPKPEFEILPARNIYKCENSTITISSSTISNGFEYFWSTGETSSSITIDSVGKYYLTVTNEYGCQSTDSVVVEYKYIQPEIEIIGNIPTCEGDTIVLRTKEKYDVYNWSTGDTTSEIYVTKSTKCLVSVIDSLGCTGETDEIDVLFYPTPKVNLRGPDTVCLGSTVTYHVNKNNNVGYGWWVELGSLVPGFNSDSVKVIWLQAGKGKIVTQQTNSFGCIGIDSMYVEIIDEVKPEIIPEKTVICGNGTLTLRTLEQYDSYIWSMGESSDSIVISVEGMYFVKVTAVGGCTGFDTVNVIKVDEPVAVIVGNTTLCKGESSVLTVNQDFAEYLWSTSETTKYIAVNQTGNYGVEVTDSNGCKASASVDVKAIIISLDGLNDTDFGRISIDNKDNKNLILTNRSNESIRIEDVRLKSGNDELSFTVNPQTPAVLDSGDIMVVNIDFEPDGMQEYKDSLIIEVSQPCEENFVTNVSGIGTGKMLVWLPDVTKEVGYNICIPLYAKLMNTKPITLDTKFDVEIRYDVTALKPTKDYLIAGVERIINYTDIDLSIDKDTSVIAELCGTVLLARENSTPIFISDFTISNPYCEVETLDGSLTILGCAIDISRVLLANNIEVRMYPNPTDDEITIQIKTDVNLNGNLIIYNSYGIEVASQTQQLKSGSNLVQFNTTNLSSGIYFVKVILNGYEYVVIPIGKIQ